MLIACAATIAAAGAQQGPIKVMTRVLEGAGGARRADSRLQSGAGQLVHLRRQAATTFAQHGPITT